MKHKRSKPQKMAVRCENMRKAKAIKRAVDDEEQRLASVAEATGYQWTDQMIEQCSAAADRLLKVAQGRRDRELRARTWAKETPVGFAVEHLSPAVMMTL